MKTVEKYFQNQDTSNITKAEALFSKFLISHNIPLAAADHAGPLFKNMFPDSKIASNYSAGRTKTTAMISLMAAETSKLLSSCLKDSPFSLSTDGSNDGGSETLFPIVIRYFDESIGEVLSTVLCIASNTNTSTGSNIFSLVDHELEKRSVSWKSCIAFGCDNASVMTGKYKGVSKYIQEKNSDAFVMGCYCHLIHIAAQKAAAKLPCSIDELLIDVYFYLNKSTKRQQMLKQFQSLCGVESRKIIKHAVTRWLSLEKCITRLLEQWQPLGEFFKCEKNPSQKKINVENNQSKTSKNLKCADSSDNLKQKSLKRNLSEPSPSGQCSKKRKTVVEKKNGPQNRLDRVYNSLHDPKFKLYCLFLKNVLPIFTRTNECLMSNVPLIHKLKRILLDLLSEIYARFLKSNAISSAIDILSVDVELKNNHRDMDTIVIGHEAKSYLNTLKSEEKMNTDDVKYFFKKVKDFYITSSKYIVSKFDLKNPLLECAEVADIAIRQSVPFSHITFFLSKFTHLFDETQSDAIETQFFRYQIENFNEEITNCNRIDLAWHKISQMKGTNGELKYDVLSKFIKMILVIPHSNAEDERIFSIVRKNLNEYRPNLSSSTLSDIIVEKMNTLSKNEKCYNSKFSKDLLTKLKSATYNSLK